MLDAAWAVGFMEQYGLYGLFVVIALEYACLPLPSEALLPLAGMAAAAANLTLASVVAVSVLAGLVGSTLCYALGALGGFALLARILPKAAYKIENARAWREGFGGLSVMVARVIPVVRTWVSFAAGLSKTPLPHFLIFSSIGIFVWNTVLLGAGYYLFLRGVAMGFLRALPLAGLLLFALIALLRYLTRAGRVKREG